MTRTDLRARLDAFLFAPVRPLPAALFRVALAGLVLAVFWPHPLFEAPGAPHATANSARLNASFDAAGGYWPVVVTLAVLFAAGVFPRVTGLMLAILLFLLVPLRGRRPGRQVTAMTVLLFSFVRSDAALAPGRRMRGASSDAGPGWPIRLIQLQLSLLYLVNAIAKTTPDYLSGGTLAVLMTMPHFLVRPVDGAITVAGLTMPLWLAATGVVLIEYWLAFGMWPRRTRMATAVMGVAFHASLRLVVRIGYLDLVSVFHYLAFVPR